MGYAATVDVADGWLTVNGEAVMPIADARGYGDFQKAIDAALSIYFDQSIVSDAGKLAPRPER